MLLNLPWRSDALSAALREHSIDDLQALPNPLDRMQCFEKLIRLRLTELLLKTN